MSIFSKLKPQKILDTVFSGIDKGLLSKEELIDYSKQAASANLEFVKVSNSESTPRSITRRIIAILVLSQYFLVFNVGLFGMVTGMFEGIKIIELATKAFSSLAVAVVIFYFGNHLLNSLVPSFAAKKNKKDEIN